MTPRGEHTVVVAGEPEAAGYAAVPYLLWAILVLIGVGVAYSLIGVVMGAARAAFWYAVVARRAVVETDEGLAYVERGVISDTVPWADLREIRLLEGASFPEWSRWYAKFPRVRVMQAGPDGRVTGDDLGDLLLRSTRGVDAAGRALADLAARRGVAFVNAMD